MKLQAALILIDFQTGSEDPVWGARNTPDAEVQAARRLRDGCAPGAPIAHVRHLSASPTSPRRRGGTEWMPALAPLADEPWRAKLVHSAFVGIGLTQSRRDRGIASLAVAGLTTPHCVSTNCRMGAHLGLAAPLAHDACAANDDTSWSDAPGAAPPPDASHHGAAPHPHGAFVTAHAASDTLSA